nr:hypothetical protein [Tanacetum cinerariifolium]
MVNATKDNFDEDDLVKFQELLLDAEKPLYEGCPNFTKLSSIVKLLNLKGEYGASDKFFTKLQGLREKMLHADSQAWRTIDEKFPKIDEDPRNLRLGISADGVDVKTENRHHSVWPVLTVIYNLPLWLCMKRMFIMLSVLILGYLGNDIDVFLEPLVDDLHTLLETGVNKYDVSTKDNFNLRTVVLWTINDYPELEKNVAKSLVRTLLHVLGKTKDGVNARLDLAELGVKPELFAMQEDKTTLLPAGYTLTNVEKDTFCETLHNIRVPQGYCSNMSSLVNLKDKKLIRLKSHDYHMLMQEFLPIAIHLIMHPPTPYAIIRFCFFLKSICSKEIILQELDKMQEKLVVTLCLLEKFFPLCMKVIKRHVRNRNKPEGCTTEETITEETIDFLSEYHKSMETIGIPPDKHETDENKEGKLLSTGKSSEVSAKIFQKAHLRHKQVLKTENPGKRIAFLENKHSKSFAKWLRKEVERELAMSKESVSETVRWISYGPRATIVKYDAYNINGYTFFTICHDGKVYQKSKVNYRAGGVKRDTLGYTLVDLNNLGHKTPPKNYKDTYDEVDEGFSTVIYQRNDIILPRVNQRDLVKVTAAMLD